MALDEFAPDVDLNAEPEAETPEIVAEEPAEEPKEEPKAEEPKQEPKQQKLVPLEALHESRIKEREWREKAAQIEREAQERFQKLEARLEKLANPPPAVPKFEEDPAGHLQHEVASTKAELATLRQTSEQARKVQEAQAFEQRIAADTHAAEQVFAKDHPDYLQAVQYLQSIADRNMQAMGVEDPIVRQAQIRADALAMSLKALQMGKSPAELAYQLAQNYGYKNQQTKIDPAKKIEALRAGQTTASIPDGGSKAQSLTLAALEQMSDEEVDQLVADEKAWKKLTRQMA